MQEYKELKEKTLLILNSNWINTQVYGIDNIGLLFEKLLGIAPGNLEMPDWGDIEIKTKSENSQKYITLFNATPDSSVFAIKSIVQNYGYPDKDFSYLKVFNVSINGKHLKKTNDKFLFKLFIDNLNKCLVLKVFDQSFNLLDDSISWSFDLLNEKLQRKLKYLLFVKTEKRNFNKIRHVKYISASLYKLRGFDFFLKAIGDGYIRVTFKIGIFKGTYKYGEMHDRGTGFDIEEINIAKLFELLEVWNQGEIKKIKPNV